MSAGKAKRKISYILMIGTLIIWGVVIYRLIVFMMQDSSAGTVEYVSPQSRGSVQTEQTFRRDTLQVLSGSPSRDPFQFRREPVRERNKESPEDQKTPQIVENTVPYTVSGVIVSEGDKLVILEDRENGRQIFLRRHQSYDDIYIVDIQLDSIIIKENGRNRKIGF
jgi:type II secretory pathway component PulC